MRRTLAIASLIGALILALAGCGGDTSHEARQTTAPKTQIKKITEVNYDDEAYYARMMIDGHECIVLVTHASESESGSGISCDWSSR